jgi:hypothetical protein
MRHVPLAGHKYVPVDIEAAGYVDSERVGSRGERLSGFMASLLA